MLHVRAFLWFTSASNAPKARGAVGLRHVVRFYAASHCNLSGQARCWPKFPVLLEKIDFQHSLILSLVRVAHSQTSLKETF